MAEDNGHNGRADEPVSAAGRGHLSPKAVLYGLRITFREFFGSLGGRNTITVQYPIEKKPMQPRFRVEGACLHVRAVSASYPLS